VTLPKGVVTVSSATEPTTTRSATTASLLPRGEVLVEQQRQTLPREGREGGGLVITALARAPPQPAAQGLPMRGSARRSAALAVATFLSRLATTPSTVTASCVSCHTS